MHLKLLLIHLLAVWHISVYIQVRLNAGSYVLNTRTGNKERISRIFQMHANKQIPIDKIMQEILVLQLDLKIFVPEIPFAMRSIRSILE